MERSKKKRKELGPMNKLTHKQQRFIAEYVIDGNATQAAIRAGYSGNRAKEIGYENLTKPHIKALIEQKQKEQTEKAGVTAEAVIKELASIGFSKVTDYLEVKDYEVLIGYENDSDGNQDVSRPTTRTIRGVEVYKTVDVPEEKQSAIAEIRQTKDGISLKLYDKTKALELLGRNLGIFKDRLEVDGELSVKKLEDFIKRG
jgi:phage terminase small subunit